MHFIKLMNILIIRYRGRHLAVFDCQQQQHTIAAALVPYTPAVVQVLGKLLCALCYAFGTRRLHGLHERHRYLLPSPQLIQTQLSTPQLSSAPSDNLSVEIPAACTRKPLSRPCEVPLAMDVAMLYPVPGMHILSNSWILHRGRCDASYRALS